MTLNDDVVTSARWVRKANIIGLETSAGAFLVPPAALIYDRFVDGRAERDAYTADDLVPFPVGFSDSVAEVRLAVERSEWTATLLFITARARTGADWFDISEALQVGSDH